MGKRYRLYINNEWISSTDCWEEVSKWARDVWSNAFEGDDYYGMFPSIDIYDTKTKEWC